MAMMVFYVFIIKTYQNCRKRSLFGAKNPVFNRGMTLQTKEKGLIKVSINLLGGGYHDRITYAGVVSYCICTCWNSVQSSTWGHCKTLKNVFI